MVMIVIGKQTNPTTMPAIHTHHRLHDSDGNQKPTFPGIYMTQLTAYDGTTTSGIQPWKNVTTMGKVYTSDLIMIIQWVTTISFHRSLNGTFEHVRPHILQIKSNLYNYILDRSILDRIYAKHFLTLDLSPHLFDACEIFCMMMPMKGTSVLKTD